jgi:DNA (cytosine-5)-methyltransferase 1
LSAAGFDVIVGIDNDRTALETHSSLFPGLALERDLGMPEAVEEVANLLRACDVTLLAGGPPCQPFSRAGSAKIKSLVDAGLREAHDLRGDLWRAWLDVVLAVEPEAVLLENVPEMAIGGEMGILRTIVAELEHKGYGVHTRILKAIDYGVPQHRQRLFLVALARGGGFEWPSPTNGAVGVGDVIGDLPPVEGGWRPDAGADGYLPYTLPADAHPLVERARTGMTGSLASRIYDHITRPVRDDDRMIFEGMDSSTRYSDLEDGPHKRYRDDIFDDKYKRLAFDEPSRSITAHIAKDGYWYIHPNQLRTLTVREAARIQTFPDRVRFAGPPSAAFRQIGNAVPPLLAERVGHRVLESTQSPMRGGPPTLDVAEQLAKWILDRDALDVVLLQARTAWQATAAGLLLGRYTSRRAREVLATLENHDAPEASLKHVEEVRSAADLVGRPERADQVLAAALWYVDAATPLSDVDSISRNPHVSPSIARLAALIAGGSSVPPILATAPVLRVAARWTGDPVDQVDKGSTGRMAIARLVGGSFSEGRDSQSRLAQAALVELAHAVCRSKDPRCEDCPLNDHCASGRGAESRSGLKPAALDGR